MGAVLYYSGGIVNKVKEFIYKWSNNRIKKLYGDFDDHQSAVYKCYKCNSVFSWKMIHGGKACDCGSRKLSPANLTIVEELKFLFIPKLYQ